MARRPVPLPRPMRGPSPVRVSFSIVPSRLLSVGTRRRWAPASQALRAKTRVVDSAVIRVRPCTGTSSWGEVGSGASAVVRVSSGGRAIAVPVTPAAGPAAGMTGMTAAVVAMPPGVVAAVLGLGSAACRVSVVVSSSASFGGNRSSRVRFAPARPGSISSLVGAVSIVSHGSMSRADVLAARCGVH